MTIGRNDPCPCGSGRKYKKCHYESDRPASNVVAPPSPLHALDRQLVEEMLDYVSERSGGELEMVFDELQEYPELPHEFAIPFLAYVARIGGRSPVQWFLEERGASLPQRSREWLERQLASWLSVWEVVEVERGHGLLLRDALTSEEREVREVAASRSLERHWFVLARVVDAEPAPLLCGMHTVPLPPKFAARVVDEIRRTLRRKTAVAPEKMREERIAWRLLQSWTNAIVDASAPPRLSNTSGDPLLFTTDRWKFRPEQRDAVTAALAATGKFVAEEPGELVMFLSETDRTVTGRVVIRDATVVAETNSIRRAEALREIIERAAGEWLTSLPRSHVDALSPARERATEPKAKSDPATNKVILEMKNEHYERWLDEQLPALDGKTPRQVARTAAGRERLRWMVNDIEILESRQPEEVRFDAGRLRRALGLG